MAELFLDQFKSLSGCLFGCLPGRQSSGLESVVRTLESRLYSDEKLDARVVTSDFVLPLQFTDFSPIFVFFFPAFSQHSLSRVFLYA